jgi:hypothetical protein
VAGIARDHQRTLRLVQDLLADAARDLDTWSVKADINWPAAGRAALVNIDASIGYLVGVRDQIVPALLADRPEHRAKQVDVEPGRIIEQESGPGGSSPSWGWSASGTGSTYTGRNDNDDGSADAP